MATVSRGSQEVTFKIVYCGPPGAGKAANLRWIHGQLPQEERGELRWSSNAADQILSFSFSPSGDVGLKGYRCHFELYSTNGSLCYHATQQLLLRGVDGIIFVADSHPSRSEENCRALAGMVSALRDNGHDPSKIPWVLQYNKRDLPDALPLSALDEALTTEVPPIQRFEACATQGAQLFDTLNATAIEVINRFKPPALREARPRKTEGSVALSS